MESSSSGCRQSFYTHLNHKRFVQLHLGPAIKGKSCPICLSQIEEVAVITVCLHAYCTDCIRKWSNLKRKCPLCNSQFTSLFVGIDLSSITYRTQHLSPLKDSATKFNNKIGDSNGRRRDFMAQRRAIVIAREELNISRRTRPLPRQRSFVHSNMRPPGVNKARILQWRARYSYYSMHRNDWFGASLFSKMKQFILIASVIYEQNMRAVPCSSKRSLQEGIMGRKSNWESLLLERIEPWIHREFLAVLGDPNPAVLVHLVTSLFISSLKEMQQKDPSGACGVDNKYLQRLQPFLLERTSTFWHELRCFAESQFNMETYDTVVKYIKWSN